MADTRDKQVSATELRKCNVKSASIDDVIIQIGEYERSQIFLTVLLCLLMVPTVYPLFTLVFLTHLPAWRCSSTGEKTGECLLNNTFNVGDGLYNERCKMNRSSWGFVVADDFSIATEFNLVCDREILSALVLSVPVISAIFGTIVLGELSARHGRKKVIFICYFLIMVISFAQAFAPTYTIFFCLSLVTGFCSSGVVPMLYVTIAELVGSKYRSLASNMVWVAYALSIVLIGIHSYLINSWRMRTIILSAPYILFVLFWRWVPESVRWLCVNQRNTEAEKILRKIAKQNNKQFPNVILVEISKKESESTMLDLFKDCQLRRSVLLHSGIWFINELIYYGIILATSYLSGRFYLDFILVSLVEIPANAVVIYACDRIGRRKSTISSTFFAFWCLLAVACIPEDVTHSGYSISRACFGIMAKFFISISFNSVYLLSAETFPTVVRTQAMALLATMLLFGTAVSPWVSNALRLAHLQLPFIVLSVLCFGNVILSFFLKETKGLVLEEVLTKETPPPEDANMADASV